MKASELQHAKNPDLIASLAAIKRAARLARQTPSPQPLSLMERGFKGISAEELKQQEGL